MSDLFDPDASVLWAAVAALASLGSVGITFVQAFLARRDRGREKEERDYHRWVTDPTETILKTLKSQLEAPSFENSAVLVESALRAHRLSVVMKQMSALSTTMTAGAGIMGYEEARERFWEACADFEEELVNAIEDSASDVSLEPDFKKIWVSHAEVIGKLLREYDPALG